MRKVEDLGRRSFQALHELQRGEVAFSGLYSVRQSQGQGILEEEDGEGKEVMNELQQYARDTGKTESEVMMMCADRCLISDNCVSLNEVDDIDSLTAASLLMMSDCKKGRQ